jgi:hypothetical protein
MNPSFKELHSSQRSGSDGVPRQGVAELMRHADPGMTLEYGEAPKPSKRKANKEKSELALIGRQKDGRELFPSVPSRKL